VLLKVAPGEMAPIWLLLGLVSLVEADWAEVESTSNGAAFMLQQRAKKQKSPSTKSLVQDDFGFIAATMIYIETAGDVPQRPGVWPRGREKSGTSHRERQEEYCVSIRENAKNRAVQEINLLTTMNASSAWSSLVDTCQLPQDVQKKSEEDQGTCQLHRIGSDLQNNVVVGQRSSSTNNIANRDELGHHPQRQICQDEELLARRGPKKCVLPLDQI